MEKENNNEFVFYSDKLNYKTALGLKGKEYFVEGYISTGDLDLVNDIVTKSCMDSMLSQFDNRSIKMDFEHEAFRGSNPIDSEAAKTRIPLGKAIIKSQDSKGVLVKWKMNSNWKKFDEKGNVVMTFKDIWNSVEDGMYDAFSIAYVPTRTKNIDREGKSIRLLDDVNLLNVALTGNAINPKATMTSVMAKSLEFMKSQEELDVTQIEIKDSIDKLEKDIEEIKHKYIKRTGSSGRYQYTYPGDNKKKESGKPGVSKERSDMDVAQSTWDNKLNDRERLQVIDQTSLTRDDMKKPFNKLSPDKQKEVLSNLSGDKKETSKPTFDSLSKNERSAYRNLTSKNNDQHISAVDSINQSQAVKILKVADSLGDSDVKENLLNQFSKEHRDGIKKRAGIKSAEELFQRAVELNMSVNMADRFIKSNLSGNNADKKHMRCTNMVDKKDEAPAEEVQAPTPEAEQPEAEAAPVEAPAEEAAKEAAPEAEAPAEGGDVEDKSMTLKEMKSVVETLTKDVETLKKENTDLKAIVEKPQQKAKGAGLKSEQIQEPVEEMKGPLDLV